jgi:hypothetical protein
MTHWAFFISLNLAFNKTGEEARASLPCLLKCEYLLAQINVYREEQSSWK